MGLKLIFLYRLLFEEGGGDGVQGFAACRKNRRGFSNTFYEPSDFFVNSFGGFFGVVPLLMELFPEEHEFVFMAESPARNSFHSG